mmetsp:Transcript_33657/g.38726  ORF Transcript_33657/g.38726 Transcript_33657/m.38726 type:complete len:158 (+) Transcript_33657:1309-1782(+)
MSTTCWQQTLSRSKRFTSNLKAQNKSFMDLNDSLNLTVRNTGLLTTEKDAIACFALSKSTVPNEFTKRIHYNSLSFVEFLEFVCRVTDTRSKYQKPSKPKDDKTDLSSNLDPVSIDPEAIEVGRTDTRNLGMTFDASASRLNASFIQDKGPLVEKIE